MKKLFNILGFIVLLSSISHIFAQDATKEIKVCFYPLAGFFEYDANGKETGYGVEVLNKISEYSDIQFTYEKVDQWEDTGKYIVNNLADIALPVSKPAQTSTKYSYTDTEIINTYYSLMTLKKKEMICNMKTIKQFQH